MPVPALLSKKILIVDDEPVNVMILEQMLQESGYQNVCGLTDPTEALAIYEAYAPDLIVLDLRMPVIDGFQVMQHIRARTREGIYLPILVVTADVVQESRRHALTAGATDFLTKPFDEVEVLLRIENLLRTRWQYLLLEDENVVLDHKVHERTQDLETSNQKLEQAQTEIMQRLAVAAEYRDDDTGQHTRRVGKIAYLLARQLGLSPSRCDIIGSAAPLHDVGKIGIPDAILLKPGRLTAEEFATMRGHAAIGSAILSDGHSPLVKLAEVIALTHHERWNGSGYPNGLSGEAIPIEGQITGIVDVFDALTHDRPYKKAWSVKETLNEITQLRSIHFSPNLTDAFMTLPHDEMV
jgi:putative two-component system response regulator